MDANEYQRLAARTLIDKPDFELSQEQLLLLNRVLSTGMEFGAVVESVKKGIFHQHGLITAGAHAQLDFLAERTNFSDLIDESNIMIVWNLLGILGEACELIRLLGQDDSAEWNDELGDIGWYWAALATKNGLSLGDVMAANNEKLRKRYPDGFSSDGSIERKDVDAKKSKPRTAAPLVQMDTEMWIDLKNKRPDEGQWVFMFLTKYAGLGQYRAGMYMGPDDWMSAANWNEPNGLLRDVDVSGWMPIALHPSHLPPQDGCGHNSN